MNDDMMMEDDDQQLAEILPIYDYVGRAIKRLAEEGAIYSANSLWHEGE